MIFEAGHNLAHCLSDLTTRRDHACRVPRSRPQTVSHCAAMAAHMLLSPVRSAPTTPHLVAANQPSEAAGCVPPPHAAQVTAQPVPS